jgi:hypothetical protein
MSKASVTLESVPLAGTGAIAWRFVGGTQPYTAVFSVHRKTWETRLKGAVGRPLTLKVTDSRGAVTVIKELYILHTAPSDSPNRVSFVVADKRWKWQYKLIARDFNMPRKTGNRTANFQSVPVETRVVIDEYDYLPYSLDGEVKWTAKRTVESVLDILEDAAEGGSYKIDSFPIDEGSAGQFTLQGITLRDQGDVALARLLSYIPGADVYIDADGDAVVYDGTDLEAAENYLAALPPSTWAGEAAAWVDRKEIRPGKVVAHYQREVEVALEFSDDYSGGTSAQPNRSAPYIDNVIPTVDPETTLTEFDPEVGTTTKTVPPGTWVRVDEWLEAMDADRPEGSLPWTFDTIKRHWLKGDLEGVLGARGLDLDSDANVAMRVQALRQHFRQTFRINRRYMERIRDIRAVRVALLDPVTGARAPAAVWGQACSIPSTKGKYMASRTPDPITTGVFRNVDYYTPSVTAKLIDTAPGPTSVNILDKELGIFRLDWITSPYGTIESFIPCHLVGEGTQAPQVVSRDLSQQDTLPMGAAMKIESGTNGIFLRATLDLRVMLTIVPAAPNNERQFHREEIEADEVASLFRREFRIQGGNGPPLEVFVPPGEETARFAWDDDQSARNTIQDLLGLEDDDPNTAGVEGPELNGFILANEGEQERHLFNHARSLAAELLAPFADNVQGAVATRVPTSGLKLVGNMSGATIRVAAAPSAKVDAVHQFPGQQRAISRLAVMPESTRAIVLGIVPFQE